MGYEEIEYGINKKNKVTDKFKRAKAQTIGNVQRPLRMIVERTDNVKLKI